MANIKFLTDSASDIPKEIQTELEIEVLAFPMIIEGKEYGDGEDITNQEFYKVLNECDQIPTHAQLNTFLFVEVYQKAWEAGHDHLIYVSINAKSSNTHQNAHQGIEQFYAKHPEAKEQMPITIIDSKAYTLAYGYPLVEGAKMAKNGESVTNIVDFITDWVDNARIIFVPFDLRFAKKSGRVSVMAAYVGEAMGIKPIITFEDGASKILSKVRGAKNVIPNMISLAEKEREEGTPYLLLRTTNVEQDEALAAACLASFGKPPEMITYIGGVISINAGPNTIGVVYRKK